MTEGQWTFQNEGKNLPAFIMDDAQKSGFLSANVRLPELYFIEIVVSSRSSSGEEVG